MRVHASDARRIAPVLPAAGLALLGAAAAFGVVVLGGTKTGLALGLAAVLSPALVYAAVVAPFAFPFCAYIVLVPFDNILDIAAFGTATKMLAIVSGASLILYMARTRRALAPSPMLLILCGLFAWMAASTFWAIDQASVLLLLPTAFELLLLYAAVAVFPADAATVRWAIAATLCGGAIAAGYGVYLFHSGIDVGRGGRLWITTDTSFIDPNHFAAALLLPAALAMAFAAGARKAKHAVLAFGLLLLLLEGIIVSASRGAILGAAVMTIYLAIRSKGRLRLLLLAAPAALAASLTQQSLVHRFSIALSSGGAGRSDIWGVGLAALKSTWLLGAGYNNFAFAYDRAFLASFQPQFSQWHRAPHDLLLGTAVELGVVGLGLTLAAWCGQFKMLTKIAPEDPDYSIRLGLEAALVATFVAALFLDVMITKYVWLIFMLVAIVRNAHLRRPTHA